MRTPGSRNFKPKYIPPAALQALRPLEQELTDARAGEDSEREDGVLRAIARIKAQYAPEFPLVAMPHSNPGRMLTREELEQLGLVAPPEVFNLGTRHASAERSQTGDARWPDYSRSLTTARRKADGTPDRSLADFNWCMTCLDPE